MTISRQKTLLVFPPQWIPLNPYFSLCSLAGYLKGEGLDVVVEDLNIRFYRHILTPEFLDYSAGKARNSHEFLRQKLMVTMARQDKSLSAQYESARILEIEKLFNQKGALFRKVRAGLPEALSVIDSPEKFYDPFELVQAFNIIDRALEIASLPYFPARIKINDFIVIIQSVIMFSSFKITLAAI